MIEDHHCADQYLVKYWQRSTPNSYQLTKFVDTDVTEMDIEVVSRVEYEFQVSIVLIVL